MSADHLRGVAADHRELGHLHDTSADGPALVPDPVHRRRRDLLGEDEAAGGGKDLRDLQVPVRDVSLPLLDALLVLGEHPVGVDLVDPHAVLAVEGVAEVAGEGHERPLARAVGDERGLARRAAGAVDAGILDEIAQQVRFEVGINALAPDMKILAPAREWGMTREQTIKYALKHEIPIPVTKKSPYSIDENLWGKSIECGVLEDPWTEPPADVYTWTKSPDEAPAKPQYLEIGFEKGIPVSLDGKEMGGIDLIQKMNEIAGRHGIGRIDHIENRVVGIKSREIYEAPAAVVLIQAHQALEAMTMSKDQLRFKQKVAVECADLIYNGLWFSQLNRDLSAYILSSQRYVSGTIRVKLFKGHATVVGRKSPWSLYNLSLATYDKGDEFNQKAAEGFIYLWGLPVKTQAQIQLLGDKEGPLSIVGYDDAGDK